MSFWYIIIAIVFFASLIAKSTKKTKNNLPPGPPRLPIIGNLYQLGTKPQRSMFKLSEKYGSLMSLKFGYVSAVVASTPDTVKDVLKTFDAECCSRPYMTYPARITYNLKDLAFSFYSKYWREVRKMTVVELYTAKRVKSFQHIRQEEVASFVQFMIQSASLERPVNLNRKLVKLSGSVICKVGFGICLEGSKLKNAYEEVIQGAMEVLGSFAAADYFPVVGKIIDRITGLHSKYGTGREWTWRISTYPRQHQRDFVEPSYCWSRHFWPHCDMRMTHLITNPRVLKKAQAEVREVIKNKDTITEEDIERLEYLKMVIKETLRMKMVIKETLRINPLVSLLIPREASKDIKIGGYDIPKKTWIYVNIWAVHRNPNVWKDPEAFIPERFMDSEIDYKGLNFELLPFGSGRRMCPGLGMGMALVHVTLINLLYRFDWKLPQGMKVKDVDLEESYGLVSPKKTPLQLIPVLTQWS